MSPNEVSISGKVGKPPGVIEYVGNNSSTESKLIYRCYDQSDFKENELNKPTEFVEDPEKVNWVDFCCLADVENSSELLKNIGAHPMFIEDVLNTNHLPKYESDQKFVALLLKAFTKTNATELKKNSVCVLLSKDTVINLYDYEHNVLSAKVERIKQGKGRARTKKADYLFYVILDAYLDTFYLKFDELREAINELEDLILAETHENKIEQIHNLKNELASIRRIIFPLKEAIVSLIKDEPDFIEDENMIYFNDLLDHMNQFSEYYQNYNEQIKSLVDLNNSNLNNNINQVMKVLTIIATIFIPLTFIAGIYGMNFENMPELKSDYGYFVTWAVMIVTTIGMIIYMRRKKWF
jgi:magnesium transporter